MGFRGCGLLLVTPTIAWSQKACSGTLVGLFPFLVSQVPTLGVGRLLPVPTTTPLQRWQKLLLAAHG